MKHFIFAAALVAVLFSCATMRTQKDPIENRIDALLKELSLEEKVGQTCQVTLDVILKRDAKGNALIPAQVDEALLSEVIDTYKVGSILNVGSHTLTRNEWTSIISAVNAPYVSGKSKSPIIYGIDAIHGMNYTVGGTLFPQEIGLAASWNPALAKQFAEITAYETRASGVRWNFSPVLDLGRQPLWSRNFETLGEDPYLASLMGAAIVEGYQGEAIGQYHVAACMKHFVGYSASYSGRDRTPAWIPEKYMKELYLPSFKKAVDAGALTVMINSGVVNGVPGHVNYQLLTETLKNEWGFKGFAVSDWEDFIMLHTVHRTSESLADAYVAAFNAGVDMSMVPLSPQYKEYCDIMVNAVKSGKISMERLDDAVRRILRVKVITGLYDDPSFNPEMYSDFGSDKFKTAALNSALESITLLKNDNKVLTLQTGGKILIAGPTADNLVFLNGAWTHTWQGVDSNYNTQNCKTVRQAIEGKFGKENCLYTKGAELVIENNFEKTNFVDLEDYAKKLDQADVVVLCLGEMPSTEKPGDIHSLNLDPEQRELAKMAYKKNKKVVLVLLEGRPRIIHDIVEGAAAIVQCYLPGDYGADALVKLLNGEVNFSGKLPYTYPKYDGVIEFYDHPRSVDRSKAGDFSAYNPEWDFGFGLSYSKVEYSALKMNNTSFTTEEKITISVNVKNTSNRSVKEVVQVYIGDMYSELVPEGKKLKRFSKVEIPANTEMTVDFEISAKDLMFVNQQGIFVHGDGEFNVFVGGLETHFTLNK